MARVADENFVGPWNVTEDDRQPAVLSATFKNHRDTFEIHAKLLQGLEDWEGDAGYKSVLELSQGLHVPVLQEIPQPLPKHLRL